MNIVATTDVAIKQGMPVIVHSGAPVVTTEQLAKFYGTDCVRLRQNHKRNSERFISGKHFHKVEGKNLADLRVSLSDSQIVVSPKTRSLILWTERGAARHAKMLETDRAWDVFEKLEDFYFSQRGEVEPVRKIRKSTATQLIPLRQTAERLIATGLGKIYPDIWKLVHQRFDIEHIHQLEPVQIGDAVEYLNALEGEFLGKQEALPVPTLDISIPLQWWLDNNPVVRSGNLSFGKTRCAPALDVTLDMLCGDNSTSAAIRLINLLEAAGFDVSAPKAEIVAMRKHLASVEYGMKAIADACRRAGNKTISFRGGKADYVIS